MIIYLSLFVNNLQQQNHERIVDIDANEVNYKPKNGVTKLLLLTKLIDVISQKYAICKKTNTYLRGRKRIDFIFCSEYIFTFLDKYGIAPFS